ncbi:hypothetical protein CVT26_013926 [Gymnopilus dilepis]|uniref:Uncharacterized protein n=1 Tax=Gymnopilus dilepis TaxID=231916 RepID=A0A409WDV6_9AGAR|nr:hypothetical protein CVT26_013926 [Gymnopilus dilepis]
MSPPQIYHQTGHSSASQPLFFPLTKNGIGRGLVLTSHPSERLTLQADCSRPLSEGGSVPGSTPLNTPLAVNQMAARDTPPFPDSSACLTSEEENERSSKSTGTSQTKFLPALSPFRRSSLIPTEPADFDSSPKSPDYTPDVLRKVNDNPPELTASSVERASTHAASFSVRGIVSSTAREADGNFFSREERERQPSLASDPAVPQVIGRLSGDAMETLQDGLAELDGVIQKIKDSTGLSLKQIFNRWQPPIPRHRNFWNIYQKYFQTRPQEELNRLRGRGRSTKDPSRANITTIRSAYRAFRKEEPDHEGILELFWRIHEIDGSNTSLNGRSRDFQKYVSTMKRLAESASCVNGFEIAFCAVGSVVQQDQSLSATFCSQRVPNFFLDRLHFSESELEAHLKAHAYDYASRTAVASRESERPAGSTTTAEEDSHQTPPTDIKETANKKRSLLVNLKDRIKKFLGYPCKISQLQTSRLPFSDLPKILAQNGWIIENWPENVPFPCDLQKGKGVAKLGASDRKTLLEAFDDPLHPIKLVKKFPFAVPACEPVIIGVAPSPDSGHGHGRRCFLDNHGTVNRDEPTRRIVSSASTNGSSCQNPNKRRATYDHKAKEGRAIRLAFHPEGVSDLRERLRLPIDPQVFDIYKTRFDAASLAWFASGQSSRTTHVRRDDNHTEFDILARATSHPNGTEMRKTLRCGLRDLMFDCASLLDKAFGGSTLVIHIPGTTRPRSPRTVDYLKAHVYFPAHMARESPGCSAAVDSMIQRFIRDVGLPTVMRFERSAPTHWINYNSNITVPPPYRDSNTDPSLVLSDSDVTQHVGRRALHASSLANSEERATIARLKQQVANKRALEIELVSVKKLLEESQAALMSPLSPKKKRLRSQEKASAQQENDNDDHIQTTRNELDDDEMPKEKVKKRRKPSASPLPPTPSRLRPDIKTTPKGKHLTGASAHRKELVNQMQQQESEHTLPKLQNASPGPERSSRGSSLQMPPPTTDWNAHLPGQLLAPPTLQIGRGPHPQLVFHPSYGWGYVMQPLSPAQGPNESDSVNPSQAAFPAFGSSVQDLEPPGVQLSEISCDGIPNDIPDGSLRAPPLQDDTPGVSSISREHSRPDANAVSDDEVNSPSEALSPISGFSSAVANSLHMSDSCPRALIGSSRPSEEAAGGLPSSTAAASAIQVNGKAMDRLDLSDRGIHDVYTTYRKYFLANVDEELQRLPEEERPEDTTKVTDNLIGATYELFKKKTPHYESLLSDWRQIYQISVNEIDISDRRARFDTYVRKLQTLIDHASALLGFETTMYVVGRDIQTDQALSSAVCSPMVRGFFHDRLCVSESEMMAHLKAHVYDNVSKRSLPKIPDVLAGQQPNEEHLSQPNNGHCSPSEPLLDPPRVPASHGDWVGAEMGTSGLDISGSAFSTTSNAIKMEAPLTDTVPPAGKRRKKGSEGDPRLEELKKRLFQLTKDCGIRQLVKGPIQFSKLPEILSSHGWVLQNWPEEMRFPCDIRTGKGVAGLSVQEQDCLLKALQHPQFPLRVHRQSEEALPLSEPAIIGVPPPASSDYTHGRRKFLDDKKTEDRSGPPRLTLARSSSKFVAPIGKPSQTAAIANGDGVRKRSANDADGSSADKAVVKKARFAKEFTLSDLSSGDSDEEDTDDDGAISSEDEGHKPIKTGKNENTEGIVFVYACCLLLLTSPPAYQRPSTENLLVHGKPQGIQRATSAGIYEEAVLFRVSVDVLLIEDPSHRPPGRAALSGGTSKEKQKAPDIIVDDVVKDNQQNIPGTQMPSAAFWYPFQQTTGFSLPATGSQPMPVPFHVPDSSNVDYSASPGPANFLPCNLGNQPATLQPGNQLLQIPNQPLLPFVPKQFPLKNTFAARK